MLHEQIGRDDRHAAARQRLVVEHAARAAPMVGMGVGEDHGRDRPLAAVLEIELHRGARAFDRGQRIHHDHAAVALDQRHVGDVEPAHLIDAGHHLEQAVVHVEPRLPPQAGIDRRRRLFRRTGSRRARGSRPPGPAARRSLAFSSVPRKPRAASSKSRVSENGSAFSVAACCAMTEAEASFGIFLGRFDAGCLGHTRALPRKKELQIRDGAMPQRNCSPSNSAGAAPCIDIFEVGHRAGGMADIELGRRARLASLIVVVAGRAVGRADHPANAGQQQFDPAILGLFRHFDFLEAVCPARA